MSAKVIGPDIYNSPAPFRPLNPWGRAMPKPKRIKSREPEPLYQVEVRNRDDEPIRLGPKVPLELANRCCEALAAAQIKAHDATWSQPYVVKAT